VYLEENIKQEGMTS
jgi:hypothetical protein